jgi:hypothetical protein
MWSAFLFSTLATQLLLTVIPRFAWSRLKTAAIVRQPASGINALSRSTSSSTQAGFGA